MKTLDIPVIDPLATGIDVGSEKLFVSIGGGEPAIFLTFTSEIEKLVNHLKANGVKSVAMEATGVYWINIFSALEAQGLTVSVVNGAHCKNLPGRKTDMKDCQWLATLHAHGLLRGGFVPESIIRTLRDYMRLREDNVRMASQHVLHMQKAMDRLNVKLHVVISDITGESGLRVIRAILNGERNPVKLAQLCDEQILEKKKDKVIESLKGLWAPEHLFALQQAWESYEHYQKQISNCDTKIGELISEMSGSSPVPPLGKKKELRHNAIREKDLQKKVAQIYGTDLTKLPCLNESTVTMLLSEIGRDMSKWKNEKHFASWMGLAPASAQSGKSRKRQKRFLNQAGRILCRVAQSMANAKNSWLASFYRRVRKTRGGLVAVKATAAKLAKMIFTILTRGWAYVEQGIQKYEEKVRLTQIKQLHSLARKLRHVAMPLETLKMLQNNNLRKE